MITTLDRMALGAYFRSYLIVWTSLISLYVVIDLFTHLDSFVNRPGGFPAAAAFMIRFYAFRIPQVFDLLAEPISLMAAAFTVSWMQRNNELLPQLSAGVPTRRVVRPVLLGAALTVALAPLNTEFLIPEVADELMAQRDDPEGEKATILMGAYDSPSGVHLEGMRGFRKDRKIENFCATFPDSSPSGMLHLTAGEAFYIPPGGGDPLTGGWMLTSTMPETFRPGAVPTNLTVLGPGRAFLKTETADYDTVSRGGTWYVFASTPRLKEMLTGAEPRRQVKLAVLYHTRVTRPLVGFLLVVVGVSVILWNPSRHVVLSAGLCLGIGLGYYVCWFGCKALGDGDFVPPPLAAWLPVMIYGPLALVSFDAVHT
jgi:lipopolysaccharide export system permease protein